MSSQGVGYPSQSHGMKNTSDPLAKQPITESAGAVASDSLAAESYNAGGEFADNRNAAPSGVSGSASTLNTTDTSAASRLDPAESASTRDDGVSDSQRGPGGVKYAEGLGGQPDFPGATNSLGYSGGPTGSNAGSSNTYSGSADSGSADTTTDTTGTGSSTTDAAPSYVANVYLADNNKPKGTNLTEDENLQGNTKTDYEIGSKDDPGRAALQNFENSNASVSTGQSSVQREIDGENVYDELKNDTSA